MNLREKLAGDISNLVMEKTAISVSRMVQALKNDLARNSPKANIGNKYNRIMGRALNPKNPHAGVNNKEIDRISHFLSNSEAARRGGGAAHEWQLNQQLRGEGANYVPHWLADVISPAHVGGHTKRRAYGPVNIKRDSMILDDIRTPFSRNFDGTRPSIGQRLINTGTMVMEAPLIPIAAINSAAQGVANMRNRAVLNRESVAFDAFLKKNRSPLNWKPIGELSPLQLKQQNAALATRGVESAKDLQAGVGGINQNLDAVAPVLQGQTWASKIKRWLGLGGPTLGQKFIESGA